MSGDFTGQKGLEYIGSEILEALVEILLNNETIKFTGTPIDGQILKRVFVGGSHYWTNVNNVSQSPKSFQMLVAKDIESGTIQEYILMMKSAENLKIDSLVVECPDGSLEGCSLLIGSTAVHFTGTTFTIDSTPTELTATSTNLISAGDRVKLVTSVTFTGTPTTIIIQLNYSLQ